MKLERKYKKKRMTFIATITSSKEENSAKKSLPQCMKKVPRGNNVVMPKKPSRCLPPKMEVDREVEIEG